MRIKVSSVYICDWVIYSCIMNVVNIVKSKKNKFRFVRRALWKRNK